MLRFEVELSIVLTWILAGAAAFGWNAFASTVALALILLHSVASKYFKRTFDDQHGAELSRLRSDLAKIKDVQDKQNLKAAFGGKGV